METSNASQFAGFALQVICRQEWVRERCLQDPQVLCSPELLLDPAISPNQVTAHFAMEVVCDKGIKNHVNLGKRFLSVS